MATVTIDGVEYDVAPKGEQHGTYHRHPEPHPDGSFGFWPHHHHGPSCEVRTAILTPLQPARVVMDSAPAVYRVYADGQPVLLSPDEYAAFREEPVPGG